MVGRFHFRNLDSKRMRATDSSNIPHGIIAGTSRFLVKTNSGILRRTNAGRDIYMTNKFNTFPVSSDKLGMRFNAIPMSNKDIVITKFSMTMLLAVEQIL